MMIFNLLITLCVFCIMEGITWLTHKYVMHGFLWYLHKDHHQPNHKSVLEKNDAFFLIFAIPSSLLMYFGLEAGTDYRFYIGLGILFYGMAYFFVHEAFIHQRVKWFRNSKNKYFKGLRRAHKIHHKNIGKEKGTCFGMLYVPKKYFK